MNDKRYEWWTKNGSQDLGWMTTWMKYFQPKLKVSRIWKKWKHERSLGQRHQLFETVSPFSNFVSGFSDNFSLLQVQTKTVSEAWPKMQRRLQSWLCIFRYNRPCTWSQASRPSWDRGVIIGLKSMENYIGRQYVSNYCRKPKKLNP